MSPKTKGNVLRIAIDLDGVICNLHNAVLKSLTEKAKTETPFVEEEISSWDAEISRNGKTFALKNEIDNILQDRVAVLSLSPVEGAINAVMKLLENPFFDISILTSRNPSVCGASTKEWVNFHFKGTDMKVLFSDTKDNRNGFFDILIDDRPVYLVTFLESSPKDGKKRIGILFDRAWNRDFNANNGIIRLKDWDSICTFLNQIT